MKTLMKSIWYVLLLVLVSSCDSCKKDKPEPPQEANLVVRLNPEPLSGLNQTMGSTYAFNVVVQSAMPAQGVTIKVDYVKDSGGSVFSHTQASKAVETPVTITGIPFNQVGTVTVVVTSVSKPANTVTKTFKLVRK